MPAPTMTMSVSTVSAASKASGLSPESVLCAAGASLPRGAAQPARPQANADNPATAAPAMNSRRFNSMIPSFLDSASLSCGDDEEDDRRNSLRLPSPEAGEAFRRTPSPEMGVVRFRMFHVKHLFVIDVSRGSLAARLVSVDVVLVTHSFPNMLRYW